MGFSVSVNDGYLEVALFGVDAVLNFRRTVRVAVDNVIHAEIAARADLEGHVGARLLGRGRNDGWRRAGGRRVGTMLGGTAQREFWAVSELASEVVWISLDSEEWSDLVVEYPLPDELVDRLTGSQQDPSGA